MEKHSEASFMSSVDDLTCPGPLFRVKVVILGSPQCGKTSLVQCLLHDTPLPQTLHSPTEGVTVDVWTPFTSQRLQNLMNRKLTGEEQQLVLELWDTTGKQVCQPAHGMFLTAKTVCVIVYDVNDDDAQRTVLMLFKIIQQKYVGSAVLVVGNKVDLLGPSTAASQVMLLVQDKLLNHNQDSRQHIVQELEEAKSLLKDCSPKDQDNNRGKQRQTGKKKNPQRPSPSADDPPELRLSQQHLTYLEARLARASGDVSFRCVTVSAHSGKGLDEFRKALLEAALDPSSFPHSNSSTIQPSTVALYDQILALREHDVVLLPWQQFQEEVVEEGSGVSLESLEDDVAYLADVGGLQEFRVDVINLPTGGQQSGISDRAHHTVTVAGQAGGNERGRYVCVHPALLASIACCCLIDDEKQSFRFEAGRFWPKDSGFKHPDPQMLCKVLEAIPQQGLVRECLLPLLWQEYPLNEDQVLHALHVLQGEGLLAHLCDQKTHCEGLALPAFPRLSVHRCHALPLLGLLPDNRPQLNWTSKPFVGDIQITWSFHLHVHSSLLQRLLAVVLFLSRQCSNYRHLWRLGVLLRVGEATVCAEQQGDERFDVACRVNGDELGREAEAVRMLWASLAPFLLHVRRVLLAWPGLHFRETVVALGQQFYLDDKVEQEPELWCPAALTMWHRGTRMTFTEADVQHELDVGLLFPFTRDTAVTSVDDWLKLVISKTDAIFSDAFVSMTSSLPPKSQENALKRLSMRGSVRHQKKKKSVEVKWHLQDESNDSDSNSNSKTTTTPVTTLTDTESLSGSKSLTAEDSQTFDENSTSLDDDSYQGKQVEGRIVTAEQEQAEAVRLASGFVAAILASALADYVAQEAEGDQDGRTLVSTAQITAARVTAEAALAVQTGDIEGAAHAVIDAVNAVKGNNPSSGKSQSKGRRGSVQSKLCTVL